MNKAFIFDLDGVLIDNEPFWESKKDTLFKSLLGESVAKKMGSTLGINLNDIYERAITVGSTINKSTFTDAFYAEASWIYAHAPIPDGVNALARYLIVNNFHIGVVSASPLPWMKTVINRLPFEKNISVIISLYDRPDLPHKPAPHGYLEAMTMLGAVPQTTIILEDSNTGLASAHAAGAFTIGLQQNLIEGYVQNGADAYASTMKSVIAIIKNFSRL